jgi:5-methylcytosine-specific restriction endonuclease McrA
MKSDKTRLQKQADDLWRDIIRVRDPVCRLCRKAPMRDAHHIMARRHKNTRHETRNGLGLCYTCHQSQGHDDPCYFRERIVSEIGGYNYALLRDDAQVEIRYNVPWLREVVERLKDELRIMEACDLADKTF